MAYVLGVIGGSGLYDLPGLEDRESLTVRTPFGEPSGAILRGRIGATTLLFLPRHGPAHTFSPSRVNYRANIYALKSLGASHVLSVSAVGSLREELSPGHLVVPSQFIDRTHHREATFFDQGVVVHVSMADPVCASLSTVLAECARDTAATVHKDKTYVCIEGPRFSTRAESHLWRAWGADIVGMTNVPEVFLAREAELPYATLALVTDYDCWRPHDGVDVSTIVSVLRANVSLAQQVVRLLSERLPDPALSLAHSALDNAVLTHPQALTPEVRERYSLLLGRVL